MSLNVSEGSGTGDSVEDLSLQVSRGKRSKVWEFFEQDLVVTDVVPKAVCKYCSVKLTCHKKSGTSSLRAHIAESCPSIGEDDRKRFLSTLKTQPLEGCFTFEQQRSRELLTKFCIHAEVPFRKFEDPYFEEYVHSLQPTYKVIGRQTIRNDAFNLFEKMKLDTRFDFQNIGSRICLTSDIWTSNQNLGYMGVTAHYINSSFNLKKKTIAMKNVKYPHTAIALEEAIDRYLIEWNIKDKIFTLTLDNASNNTSACSLLQSNYKHDLLFEGEHLHVRCCAHILNILVQDGIAPINGAISKIRHLILHIASSPSRLQVFNGIASEKNLPTKHGLATDVEHRWNSTFDMVDDAIKYKVVFNAYASEKGEATPTDVEWKNAEAISAFLRAFEDATKVVSAHNKPTAHMFLHIVLFINHALEEAEWHSDNSTLKELGKKMRDKFDKYWEKDYNVVLLIATVLDPSRRLFYLEWFYEKTCVTLSEVNKLVDIVKKWMKKYYEEYDKLVKKDDSQQRPSTTESSRILGSPVLGKRKFEEEFHEYRSIRRKGLWCGPKSELELYYEEEPDDNIDDVLLWWKQNAEKYPILSLMARDFLAVPLSTVSSESAFSSGGRILGDTRSSLTPEMLEALVCAKDWLAKPQKGDASLWR